MDKLIPLDVAIRKDQLEQKRKDQQKQINQKWNNQQFASPPEPSDKGSAFRDRHIASAYAKVRNNNAQMENDMVHATSSSPYKKTTRNTRSRNYRDAVDTHEPRQVFTVSPAHRESKESPSNQSIPYPASTATKKVRFGVKPKREIKESINRWGV